MTDSSDKDGQERIDELIDRSKPHAIVTIAAGAIALMGFALFLTGLQALLLIGLVGFLRIASIVLMVFGAGAIVAAYGFGKARRAGAWAGLALSVLGLLVSGAWVLLTFLGGVISLLGPIAFACAIAALVLGILGFGPCLRAARARAEMEAGDLGVDLPAEELHGSARSTRRGWVAAVFGVVALALVAVVVVMVLQGGARGRITRIVVIQQGSIDPGFDGTFVELFREALEEYGLDAIAFTQPVAPDAPVAASAREIMRQGEAAHAVVLQLSASRVREGVVPATGLFAVDLTVHLVSEDEAVEVPTDSMDFAFDRATSGEVFRFVHETWIDALVPWVLDNLYRSPGFDTVVAGQVNLDEVPFASKLQGLEASVTRRRKAVLAYTDYCYRERERLGALSAGDPRPARCVGDPCGQYTLIGVDSQNRGIVQDISRRPIFSIPLAGSGAWAEPPERILAITLSAEGGEQELMRAGHFYGFGNVSPDGRFAAVQPFGDGDTLAVLAVDLATGERHDVSLLRPRERTSWALPAPDGQGTAVLLGRRGWAYLQGSRRVELPDFNRAGWVRLDVGLRIVGQLRSGELALASPDGAVAEPRPLLEGRLEAVFDAVDGSIPMLVRIGRACDLVQVSASDLTVSDRMPLPVCPDGPAMLPDGRLVGTADVAADGDAPGDPEVVVLDPESATVTPLTTGAFIEESVYPTRDGARVVFNRRLEDWPEDHDLRIYRRVVCWVDVPSRP